MNICISHCALCNKKELSVATTQYTCSIAKTVNLIGWKGPMGYNKWGNFSIPKECPYYLEQILLLDSSIGTNF